MAEQPPSPQLHDLPVFLLARIVRSLATGDARAATALACTCRLLAAVSADELLVFAPLCRELQAAAPLCRELALQPVAPAAASAALHRPHACAYVALRLGAWLTRSLWRGAGDDAGRRYAFFWKTDGGVECTELDAACAIRAVGSCYVGRSGGDASAGVRDSTVMDVLRLDSDRCVLSFPPEEQVVSAVASAIVGECRSPVGSPSSNFAVEYLKHTHTLVKTSRRRRAGQQAGPDVALLRVAPLAQVSIVLGETRPHAETAESALDIAAGVTSVRCLVHQRCMLSFFWLRGGRLVACCTHGGAPPRDVCSITPP